MNQPRMNRAVMHVPMVEKSELRRVTIKPAGTVMRAIVRDSRAFGSLAGANRYAENQLEQGLAVQMTLQNRMWYVVVMAPEYGQ